MTLTMSKLVNEGVLVRGQDINGTDGSIVLDGSQWAEVNAHRAKHDADEVFEKAVDDFFAPLVEAAEAAGKAIENVPDSLTYVVLHEGVEGQQGRSEQRVALTHDSQVIRLLESGAGHSRLVWDGQGNLAILAEQVQVPVAPPVPSSGTGTGDFGSGSQPG